MEARICRGKSLAGSGGREEEDDIYPGTDDDEGVNRHKWSSEAWFKWVDRMDLRNGILGILVDSSIEIWRYTSKHPDRALAYMRFLVAGIGRIWALMRVPD